MPLAAPPGPLWTADAKEPHPVPIEEVGGITDWRGCRIQQADHGVGPHAKLTVLLDHSLPRIALRCRHFYDLKKTAFGCVVDPSGFGHSVRGRTGRAAAGTLARTRTCRCGYRASATDSPRVELRQTSDGPCVSTGRSSCAELAFTYCPVRRSGLCRPGQPIYESEGRLDQSMHDSGRCARAHRSRLHRSACRFRDRSAQGQISLQSMPVTSRAWCGPALARRSIAVCSRGFPNRLGQTHIAG